MSYRTLHRYTTTELGFGQRKTTVRVADCEPGAEVQVTSGRLGMLTDQGDGRRRVVRGLIFTAVYSRHMFVCPTYRQTLGDVIAGFEAAWAFFWRGVRRSSTLGTRGTSARPNRISHCGSACAATSSLPSPWCRLRASGSTHVRAGVEASEANTPKSDCKFPIVTATICKFTVATGTVAWASVIGRCRMRGHADQADNSGHGLPGRGLGAAGVGHAGGWACAG